MYKNVLLLSVTFVLSIWSLCSTIWEWDHSKSLQLETMSYSSLSLITSLVVAASTAVLIIISVRYFGMRPSEVVGNSSVIYQSWISLVFARSCHVWVTAVAHQTIVNVCGVPITLGAPMQINWTCVEGCDENWLDWSTSHALPFMTNDILLNHTSPECSEWFEEDKTILRWIQTWEIILFSAFVVHIIAMATAMLYDRQPLRCSFLLAIDVISCVSVYCIAIVPHAYYSAYQLGGIFRFLGLMHVISSVEPHVKTKALIGCLLTLKVMFVVLTGAALMFVAEKPCSALLNECEPGFQHFGNTVYFTFVTLSTVGYGDMSPKTDMGKAAVVFIVLMSISYLPSVISEVIEMCRKNIRMQSSEPNIHARLDDMHNDIKQVGFFMHAGTLNKNEDMLDTDSKSPQHRRKRLRELFTKTPRREHAQKCYDALQIEGGV